MDEKKTVKWEFPRADGNDLEYPHGLKWTKQRKLVYRVLKEATEPLNATQIYSRVEKASMGEEYALSTIYRILAAFEEKGYVEKTVWMEDGSVVYSINRGEHKHYAICLECHKRMPLQSCPFAHIHLEKDTGDFIITSHKLELYGYCKDCKEVEKIDGKNNFAKN